MELERGDFGPEVAWVQERLNAHGLTVGVDKAFGSRTEAAVRSFQQAKALKVDGIVGSKTRAALAAAPSGSPIARTPPHPLLPYELRRVLAAGHPVVWRGDSFLHLTAFRNPAARPDAFDCILVGSYTVDGLWQSHTWPITTVPGVYFRENPGHVDGVAALVEGQYAAWKVGQHRATQPDGYEALVQGLAQVDCYRDGDRNKVLTFDPKTIARGWFGINIHRSWGKGIATSVGRASAGCLAHAAEDGFQDMMRLAREQVRVTGHNEFTLTLLREAV